MKIAILYDQNEQNPQNPDNQDTLIQCEQIKNVLTQFQHEVTLVLCTLDLAQLKETLEANRPDLVFNLIESLDGYGKYISWVPTLLENLGIPFTGASANSLYLTNNKLLAKEILRLHKLPTPDWITCNITDPDSRHFSLPKLIIKSVWENASIGLDENSIVESKPAYYVGDEINKRTKKLGRIFFAEEYIPGREFNVSLLEGPEGPEVLPIAEMEFLNFKEENKPHILSYKAKWDMDSFEYRNTKRRFTFSTKRDSLLLHRLTAISLHCWEIFKLRGYARVDFRVTQKGKPYILEVNTNPGLSPDTGFVASAQEKGLTYSQIIQRILGVALHYAQ